MSRLLKITGLFCRILSFLQGSFAKETCDFKEPTKDRQEKDWPGSETRYLEACIEQFYNGRTLC